MIVALADIAPAFAFILERGFVAGESRYEPEHFGDALLVMHSSPFSLRFVRDRGQDFVDVGSASSGWTSLGYVLEFIDHEITQSQLGKPPDIGVLAKLLQAHWDEVVELFGNLKRMSQFNVFAERKAAEFLSKIFGER